MIVLVVAFSRLLLIIVVNEHTVSASGGSEKLDTYGRVSKTDFWSLAKED